MIHASEQQVVDLLNDRLEDLKKTMKQYHKYSNESQVEFDQHYKKLGQLTKSYQNQLSNQKDDTLNLNPNFNELIQLFEFISKTKLSQYQDFMNFLTISLEQYNEKMNNYTKKITDNNFNNVRTLAQTRTNCKKIKEKYDKACKDIEQTINSTKKNQSDANTGYDMGISSKNDGKLKEYVKLAEQLEQQYREQSELLQTKNKEFDSGLDDALNNLVGAQQFTVEKVIEMTMKQDQHRLLANNWIKGQIDEKKDRILQSVKLESEIEDKILYSKYEQENAQIKYSDIINKLLASTNLSDQEHLAYPDLLHKHIDSQMGLINDRIKNLKILMNYMIELGQLMESAQKGINKVVKAAIQFIQEKNEKDKYNFIKPILTIYEMLVQHHDSYAKRFYQQSQFIILKSSCLDTIIKDQKTSEKSFQNMYQKMLKEFQQTKDLMWANESKPQLKEHYLTQLKKLIKDNSMAIKFSLDQVRQNEYLRFQQIIQTLDQLITHYNAFIDETILITKKQEEILNNKYDLNKEQQIFPISLKCEHIEIKFVKVFEMTEEIKAKIEEITILQQDDEDIDEKNLEEGSVKVSQKLLESFRIQEGDKCLASFACAFDNKILLQGRMYIFTGKVCFHSYFNAKTIFGTTALAIPSNEIQSIRRVKAYLVDAAIEFKTNKGVLVFASFSNRERVMGHLKQVKGLEQGIIEEKIEQEIDKIDQAQIKPELNAEEPQQQLQLQQSQQQTKLQDKATDSQQLQNTENSQPTQKQPFQQQQQQDPVKSDQIQLKPIKQVDQRSPQSQSIEQKISQPAQSQLSTQQQLSDQKLKEQNDSQQQKSNEKKEPVVEQTQEVIVEQKQQQRPSNDMHQRIMVEQKQNRFMNQPDVVKFTHDYIITVQEFTEHLIFDKEFENYISFQHHYQIVHSKDKDVQFNKFQPIPEWGSQSKRVINFVHPVREKQMFAPDTATCSAEDNLYLFSKDEVLMEKEVSFFKIPYGDHFQCRVFWHLTTIEGGCRLNYGFYIHFIKNTVFKKKIVSSSKLENTEVWEKFYKILYQAEQEKIISLRQDKKEINQQEDQIVKQNIDVNPVNIQFQDQQQQQDLKQQQIIEDNKNNNNNNNNNSILEAKLDKLNQLAYVIIGLLILNLLFTLGR